MRFPFRKSITPDGLSLAPLLKDSEADWPRGHHIVQYHGGAGNSTLPAAFDDTVVTTEHWTWLFDEKGKAGGAYFTEVEPLK